MRRLRQGGHERAATGDAAILVVFEHSGHRPFEEERARFVAVVGSFLRDGR